MRKKTAGSAGLGSCHDDYSAGGAAPAGGVAPRAAIFTGARGKNSTSKVLQTGIILHHEAVGRNEGRAQEQRARSRARDKNFDEQSVANGDYPSP